MPIDWARWHDEYDDPDSVLAARLRIVVDETRQAISRAPEGPVRIISICAGQGRDVVRALAGHARQQDVSALLVELNTENVESARARAAESNLTNVVVVQADGSITDAYASHVPAHIVLVCGVFGSVAASDIRRAIFCLPVLCAPAATAIWTRYVGGWNGIPDLSPQIRSWFREAGFAELAYRTTGMGHGVGTNYLVVPPPPYESGRRLFRFHTWNG